MKNKRPSLFYRVLKWAVRLCYPKMQLVNTEYLPDEPAIIVANHAQINGPIACELYWPGNRYIWCAGQMMHLKEVPAYAYEDFWSRKPRAVRWFYKGLSYVIAPLSVVIFNNAATIPVYHDVRLFSTFKTTLKALQDGASVVIFPEHDLPHNAIVYDFQDKFIDVARMYHKKTGKELPFVPVYITPELHAMHIGRPVRFDAARPIEEERRRLCEYLMAEITDMARALPEHTVIPYRNIPRKDYPTNKEMTS